MHVTSDANETKSFRADGSPVSLVECRVLVWPGSDRDCVHIYLKDLDRLFGNLSMGRFEMSSARIFELIGEYKNEHEIEFQRYMPIGSSHFLLRVEIWQITF